MPDRGSESPKQPRPHTDSDSSPFSLFALACGAESHKAEAAAK